MEIIFVHGALPVGGAEILRKTVATELKRRGVKVRICLIKGEGEIADELRATGVAVDCLWCSNSIYNPITTLRLAGYLRRHSPKIVQSSQFNSNYHTRIAAGLANVPVVICEEHGVHFWKDAHHRWIDRRLANWCDRIIAVSGSVKDFNVHEVGIPPKKIEILHNCLDAIDASTEDRERVRSELGISPTEFVVGHVGTLRQEKGHDTLLQAFASFQKSFPSRLLLIGDGPLRIELQELAISLNIAEKILFMGTRRDVPSLQRAMDLFAFPSRNEALSIALLDAMYQRLPIVATRCGGIPEIIKDMKTGLLVKVDDPSALAAAMTQMAGDPELRSRLGEAAHEHVLMNHLPSPYVDRLLGLYNELLAARGCA